MLKNGLVRKNLVKELSLKNFSADRHKIIFASLVEITNRNLDVTPGTIKSFIPKDSDYGGNEYLDKLENLASESNIEYHITRTKWDVTRNDIILKKLPEIEALLKDTRLDPEDVLKAYSQIELQIKNVIINDKSIKGGKDITSRYKATECAREMGVFTRTSGYRALDSMLIECFSPGKFSVLSAASSIGKTTLATNMLARQARDYKVGYMPWEGGITSTIDLLCASQLNIPLWKLIKRRDLLSTEETKKKNEFLEEYIDTKRITFLERPPKELIKGKPHYAVNDIVMDWFEQKLEEWDVDIFYWDLFELSFPDTQPQSMVWMLNRFQDLLDDTNKHGVLLQQINLKTTEKNKSKKPTRDLIKGTGAYSERPDFVYTLYREGYYDRSIPDDTLELTCWKQRNGRAPFRMVFDWNGECKKITGGREVDMFDNSYLDLEV